MLGVPRGAVPMARIIASALDGELDVVLVRKLRAPFQPELAIGAVDEAGSVLKGRYLNLAEVSEDYLREEIHTQLETLRRRRELFLDVSGIPAEPLAEETARAIDLEVKALVVDAHTRARSVLTEHRNRGFTSTASENVPPVGDCPAAGESPCGSAAVIPSAACRQSLCTRGGK